MTEPKAWTAEELAARVERCRQGGRLEGLEIEVWIGGGPPPPMYRSDQLRWRPTPAGDVLVLSRPHYDDRFRPYPVDTFELPATAAEVTRIAGLVQSSGVLTLPTDEKVAVPTDGLHAELILSEGQRQFLRRYHAPWSSALAPLVEEAAQLRERLLREGSRARWHDGKPMDS